MLTALFLSHSGTFLQFTAQSWYLWHQTHNVVLLGQLALVQATPLLGIPLFGGLLADRYPRKYLLLFTQGLLGTIAASMGLLALLNLLSPPLLILLAGILSVVTAIDNPIRQVYLPGVVNPAQRARIVSLNALVYNGGAVIGSALAGILLVRFRIGWIFLLNAISYVFTLLWLLKGPLGKVVKADSIALGNILSRIQKTPLVLPLLLTVALVSLLGRSYPHVLPIIISKQIQSEPLLFGIVAALPGIGAILAAGLLTGNLRDKTVLRVEQAAVLLLGLSLSFFGFVSNIVLASIALLVIGFSATLAMTTLNARLQITVPDAYRGRIMSIYTLLAAGMPALGGWLLAILVSAMPVYTALGIPGIILVFYAGFWLPAHQSVR